MGDFHCIVARNGLALFFNLLIVDAGQTKAINCNILNFILGKATDLITSCSTNKKPGFWLKQWVNQLLSLDHPKAYVTNLNLKWKCLNLKTFHRTVCSSIFSRRKEVESG